MTKAMLDMENILRENSDKLSSYQRNLLKDYLQILTLRFIFSEKKYAGLIFYGGSALAQCHGLPRLFEDLDFVDLNEEVNLQNLAKDLVEFFRKETDLSVEFKIQKFRIYLKFPVLKELKLAEIGQSDFLFLKVEVFPGVDFCKKYKLEIKPIFKFNQSILVKTFDLPTLMATKIRAVIDRRWERKDKTGKLLVSVKGRDYFDLWWYLQKKIRPNMECLEKFEKMDSLKKKLLETVDRADVRSIVLDLENFIVDEKFVKNLGKNIKDILKKEISGLLEKVEGNDF